MPTRCALYARVSTTDQHCENQLAELRTFCAARGWTITRQYVDHGVSGAKERRPALGAMFASLNEGIDATTPAGRLQMHMLAALSEFERGRIQEI